MTSALLAKPAEALRETRRLLRHGSREETLERMQVEGEVFSERLKSAEAQAAIGGFFAGRNKGQPG